tara:strand:- start:1278 stop:1475 length:198 start_codon:yes stop_codon:yes gene_type:complete
MSMADEPSEAAMLAAAAVEYGAVWQLLQELSGWGELDIQLSQERKKEIDAAFAAATIMVELGVEI